jgi:hypothetical protein
MARIEPAALPIDTSAFVDHELPPGGLASPADGARAAEIEHQQAALIELPGDTARALGDLAVSTVVNAPAFTLGVAEGVVEGVPMLARGMADTLPQFIDTVGLSAWGTANVTDTLYQYGTAAWNSGQSDLPFTDFQPQSRIPTLALQSDLVRSMERGATTAVVLSQIPAVKELLTIDQALATGDPREVGHAIGTLAPGALLMRLGQGTRPLLRLPELPPVKAPALMGVVLPFRLQEAAHAPIGAVEATGQTTRFYASASGGGSGAGGSGGGTPPPTKPPSHLKPVPAETPRSPASSGEPFKPKKPSDVSSDQVLPRPGYGPPARLVKSPPAKPNDLLQRLLKSEPRLPGSIPQGKANPAPHYSSIDAQRLAASREKPVPGSGERDVHTHNVFYKPIKTDRARAPSLANVDTSMRRQVDDTLWHYGKGAPTRPLSDADAALLQRGVESMATTLPRFEAAVSALEAAGDRFAGFARTELSAFRRSLQEAQELLARPK